MALCSLTYYKIFHPSSSSQVCILARESGLMVEMADIPVESLVPEPLRAVKGGDEYMSRLPEFDAEMEKQLKSAEATGEVSIVT